MEQKDYVFKLLLIDKLSRLCSIKALATEFFKRGDYKKALKHYQKVNSYFRTKDAKNNFQKEDEGEEGYVRVAAELDTVNKTCLTNMCVIQARAREWREVVKHAEEALTVDTQYVKALYHKGRAHLELTEYPAAIEALAKANTLEPQNAEVKKELARADNLMRAYKEKEAKMFQKMFAGGPE
jgi:tetratricopeptide (TPR) repeat protein